MTANTTTNGEYYDHQRQTWMVQCGTTAVPIRKLDTNGQPVPPPDLIVSSAGNGRMTAKGTNK